MIAAPPAEFRRFAIARGGSPMRRPASFVTMLSRALRPSGIFALLAAALTIGGIKGAAAASEIDILMAGRGKDVHFAVSCDPKLQPRFDAALAALHSFWYGQAR